MHDVTVTEPGLHVLGEVALGFPPPRTSYARSAYANTEPSAPKMRWVTVRPDGSVVAYAGKVEYGQGIRTGLAIEVADELRVPVEAVTVVLGDTDLVPWDMGTFGSQSTARVGLQLRKAAATARAALLELAADRLDLPVSDLEARAGRVAAKGDGARSVSYGELLAGVTLEREIPDDAPLTPPGDFIEMGRHHLRVDAVERVTGRATYSQDVMLDGMLFAAVLRPPARGARVTAVDAAVAERMPGVVSVVQEDRLVAVLAETDEQANAAAAMLQATWDESRVVRGTQVDLPRFLVETAHDPFVTQEAGSLDEGFARAEHVLEATYYVPYVTNAPMEPRAAVAAWDGDRLTVWAGTQRPFGIRAELAQAFGIEEDRVRVIAPEIGGAFGSKSPYPIAIEAARLSKIAGRPVRVAFSRTDDTMYATVRPAALITVRSGFMRDGTLVAWESHGYHAGERPFLGRRGSDTPYAVAHVRVTTYTSGSPLATGSYRSLGGAANHFAREAHMDEIAHATGTDPVELRLRNLTSPRFRRVLERAAERHGWPGAKAAPGSGSGVAVGIDVGSYVGMCVDVDVQGAEVRVPRVTVALDCGLVVNPDGAINQVEGSVVMGMGTALWEAIDYHDGRILNAGFTRYRVPRISDAPRIDTLLVGDAGTPSTGAGEPAIVPVAPAIANAVFAATGQRHRELPIGRYLR